MRRDACSSVAAQLTMHPGTIARSADVALFDSLPDLALSIGRNGLLLGFAGGHGLTALRPAVDAVGKPLAETWSAELAATLGKAVRRVIADRADVDIAFEQEGEAFEARVSPVGPDRAICMIRAAVTALSEDSADRLLAGGGTRLDRRGFLRRFTQSIAVAALNEKPLAVCLVQIEGLRDIAQTAGIKTAEQVMDVALDRMGAPGDALHSYLGRLGDDSAVIVLNSADREAIDTRLTAVCRSLEEKIVVRDAGFHVNVYAGAALVGRDGTRAQALLDHARAAAGEAVRSGVKLCFFSDTLKLRSLARLDVARELHHAISNGDITLRYAPRHELATGRLTALVAYFRWVDPLRGEVRPAEFLKVAESTGQSVALSRTALQRLREDQRTAPPVAQGLRRLSYGPPHQHILSSQFLDDIREVVAPGGIPAGEFELRVAERSYIARDVELWRAIVALGVRLVVDEFGRKVSSLELLARGPIWGLQLDRRWACALETDPASAKVCKAIIGVAAALDLTSIATGVDGASVRDALLRFGCEEGMGDLYRGPKAPPGPGVARGESM